MSRRAELPRRPAVPLTLYALVCLVVSIRLVLQEGTGFPDGIAARSVCAAGAAALASLVVWREHLANVRGLVVVICISALVGAVLASGILAAGDAFLRAREHTAVSDWQFRVVGEPSVRDELYRCRATMFRPDAPQADVWLTCSSRLESGTVLRGIGTFAPNGEDEWGVSSRMQGVWGSVKLVRITSACAPDGLLGAICEQRNAFLQAIQSGSSKERALLAGCTCGWRDGIASFGLRDVFARCGLSHLIAVSGSHMAVLSALATAVLSLLGISPRVRALVVSTLCGAFVVACGVPLSAVRALIMTSISLVGTLVGRRAHALSGVSVAGLAMVLVEPTVSGQTGFLLSAASVIGLCLLSSYMHYVLDVLSVSPHSWHVLPKRIARVLSRAGSAFREAVAASVVAQASTLPIVIETFDEVSLVGPLAGALVSLPFTLFVGLGILAFACGWFAPLQHAVLMACDLLASCMLGLAEMLVALPLSSARITGQTSIVQAVIWALLVALLLFWPTVSRRALLAGASLAGVLAMSCVVSWRFFAYPRICVLDVGQGDAILIQDGAAAVLVDAGPGDAVLDALARNHVLHLDAVVITHLHEDHYEGVLALAGRVRCDRVLVAQGTASNMSSDLAYACRELTGEGAEELTLGDKVRVGGFSARVVWPVGPVDGSENAHSLEMLVSYDSGGKILSALLTGDAERDEMAALIESGLVGDIDFLKVGHHGSEVSITPEQARAIDPEVSVASAGKDNAYGHPTDACIQVLEGAGSVFICTKDVGDVEVLPSADGPLVQVREGAA